MQLGLLSVNHAPLVAAFEGSTFGGGDISRTAELTTQDWRALLDVQVDGQAVGAPDGIQGTGNAQLDNYASLLKKQAEAAFPSATLIADIKRTQSSTDLTTFLDNNTTFTFGSTDVDDFLTSYNNTGITDEPGLKKQLKRLQRLYRLSPATDRYTTMDKLDGQGIRSARDITRMGRKRFVGRFTTVLGDAAAARQVYNRAQMATSMAQILYLQGSALLRDTPVAMIPAASAQSTSSIPGFDDMFTISAGCSCEHCTSVLSPAAYFVDLMEWLKERDALKTLLDRRPDLELVKLSCENTHTALPYVDLAIEILEEAVATGDLSNLPTETTRSTDALIAQPEHTTAAAYSTLKSASGPLGLPFHSERAQVEGYLEHLGVELSALLGTFQVDGSPTDAAIEDAYVHIFPQLRTLLTTTTPANAHTLWGYSAATGNPHPSPAVPGTVDWKVALAYVPEFLKRAELSSFEELRDLLHARYINDPASPDFTILPEGECDIANLYFNNTDPTLASVAEDALVRVVLFRRLQRLTGWSALELDKALHALNVTPSAGNTGFTDADLTALLQLKRLAEHTEADLSRVLSWWKTIDTFEDRATRDEPVPSLFDEIFLDSSVTDPATSDFALNPATRTELATTGSDVLANHETELLAAYKTTADELTAAASQVKSAQSVSTLDRKMEHLWWLLRRLHLAQTAGLSVEDTGFFSEATGLDPFSDVSTALQWFELLAQWRTLGFSVPQLRWLLAHHTEEHTPTDESIQEVLGGLRDALMAIETDGDVSGTASGTLAALKKEAITTTLSGALGFGEELMAALAAASFTTTLSGSINDIFLDEAFTTIGSGHGASTPWADLTRATHTDAFNVIVLLSKLNALFRVLGVEDADTLSWWLGHVIPMGLLDLDTIPLAASTTNLTSRAAALYKTARMLALRARIPLEGEALWGLLSDYASGLNATAHAALLSGTEWSAEDIGHLTGHFGLHDITLTVDTFAPSTDHTVNIAGEEFTGNNANLNTMLVAMRDAINADAVVGGGASVPLVSAVCLDSSGAETSSSAVSLKLLAVSSAAPFNASVPNPNTFTMHAGLNNPDGWESLLDTLDVVHAIGANASEVIGWAIADSTSAVAEQIRMVARSKHDSVSSWSGAIKATRDRLRDRQRDALVAWLLANNTDLNNTIQIYDRYLIDVEMSPCMLTSRIKQATASVQLFIQRCFLGLESYSTTDHYIVGESIIFDEDDAEEWEWRKNYRVWEAARKVFLFPENWIEPELRQVKTELFEELESDVLQNEATERWVEEAFTRYLEKLHDLSNPFIAGMYHELDESTDTDVLHVFGQTRSEPVSTWYRRFENQTAWTPWEATGLDISARRLAPVAYAGRLMVFWVDVQSATDEDGSTHLEIRLFWSEYRNDQWSPKQQASEVLSTDNTLEGTYLQDKYVSLRSSITDGELTIRVSYRTSTSDKDYTELVVGEFVLDLCTWEMNLDEVSESNTISGTNLHYFFSSSYYQGFRINAASGSTTMVTAPWVPDFVYSTNDETSTSVYQTDVVELPAKTALVMTFPHQYPEFYSQAPFVLQGSAHSYLAIPSSTSLSIKRAVDAETSTPTSRAIGTVLSGGGVSSALYSQRQLAKLPTFQATTKNFDIDASLVMGGPSTLFQSKSTELDFVEQRLGETEEADVSPTVTNNSGSGQYALRMQGLHHPYVCDFLREIRTNGVMGLLQPDPEGTGSDLIFQAARNDTYFTDTFSSIGADVSSPYPVNEIDFDPFSPHGIYNWEVFFHIPFYVASRLADNQQFEEALKWYHAIFDPRKGSSAWRIKPLIDIAEDPIDNWAAFTGQDGDIEAAQIFQAQIGAWEDSPFDPHAVAQLRPTAYQRAIVMKYLDAVIAWGDDRFSVDTMESINEATQLYLYALSILGERPVPVDRTASTFTPKSYKDLSDDDNTLDDFANVMIEIENRLPIDIAASANSITSPMSMTAMSYFCVPNNDVLAQYWDTVEDRLYKIRNCMNIQGVRRTLALFEPPIDPAALVLASASGASVGDVVTAGANRPVYRFATVLQVAKGLAGSVRALGGALQAALEKQDGEELALLRSTHEGTLLEMARQVRQLQIDEATESLRGAEEAKKLAEKREEYYQGLIDDGLIPAEKKEDEYRSDAKKLSIQAAGISLIASSLSSLGHLSVGTDNSKKIGAAFLGSAGSAVAAAIGANAADHLSLANKAATTASRTRRKRDWKFQLRLAKQEQEQHDRTIASAQKRLEAAQQELTNHDKQIEQRKEIYDWMKAKFTNQELYAWQSGQLATLYSQSYQLAVDVARKAEEAYRYELNTDTTAFVRYTHWDSLRKGLLASEQLQYDLDRMEVSFMDNNVREFDLTKHVSMSRLDPVALERLRQDGECWLSIPEALFDLDCPGHYYRRIQSVAVTIACVSGAQRQINMKLTMHNHAIRTTAGTDSLTPVSLTSKPSIVTSAAVEDPGLFSPDGSDGRYTPFERLGAISDWHLQFCNQLQKQFDWGSISDVVFHIRYTARDGEAVRDAVATALPSKLAAMGGGALEDGSAPTSPDSSTGGLVVAVSARRDSPDGWHQAQTSTVLSFEVGSDRIPYFAAALSSDIKTIHVLTTASKAFTMTAATSSGTNDASSGGLTAVTEMKDSDSNGIGLYHTKLSGLTGDDISGTGWPDTVSLTLSTGNWADVDDVLLVIEYGGS